MKNFLLISLAALAFSCSDTATQTPVQMKSEAGYVQLDFLYTDGTSEKSRIVPVTIKSSLRTTSENITIKKVAGGTELEAGDYGLIDIADGAWLKIHTKATVQNWNIGKGAVINVYDDADLTATGSLNMNGNVTFINESPNFKILGNVDIQNGNNIFESTKSFSCNEFQILDGTSIFKVNGCEAVFSVSNAVNLSSQSTGKFVLANGAQLVTNILNVNSPNVVSGEGSIKVLNTLNLNNTLTESSSIKFCWVDGSGKEKPINDPSKLGAAKRSCEVFCAPLPVRIINLSAQTISENEAAVRFLVTENSGLSSFKVNYSTDGKTWSTRATGTPEDLIAGKEYVKRFSIK